VENNKRGINRDKFKKAATAWLIMAPSLILFAFFVWEPLFESIRLSLYTAKGIRLQAFIGLENYIQFLLTLDFGQP
jgi:multiple sugar transport system permease protein